MAIAERLPVCIFIFCAMVFGFSLNTAAQNKVVVIPLTDDGITCKGTLVGIRWCDNGDSTVTDMTTGLVWLKYADWGGKKPWRSDTSGDHDDADTRAGILQDGVVVLSDLRLNSVSYSATVQLCVIGACPRKVSLII